MSLPNLVGQVLGQYEILELLGIGGMGAVYRAQQLRLKRPVALKVLSPALAAQPGYIERFIHEAETAASLEHNHIVPVYDFGADEDWPYIVIRVLRDRASRPYCPGGEREPGDPYERTNADLLLRNGARCRAVFGARRRDRANTAQDESLR